MHVISRAGRSLQKVCGSKYLQKQRAGRREAAVGDQLGCSKRALHVVYMNIERNGVGGGERATETETETERQRITNNMT